MSYECLIWDEDGTRSGCCCEHACCPHLVEDEREYIEEELRKLQKRSPRYAHDCDKCTFLGYYNRFDLYVCPSEPTVIARFGELGDYYSGLSFTRTDKALREAKRRAEQVQLL